MDFNKLQTAAKNAGILEIELYELVTKNLAISLFDDKIDQREENSIDVCAIRGVYNNQIATVYTEKNTNDSISEVIRRLKEAASVITKDDPFFIYGGDSSYVELLPVKSDFTNYTLAEKIDLLQNIVSSLKVDNPYFYHSQAEYSESYQEVRITNSNGLQVSRKGEYAVIATNLICAKEGQMKEDYDYKYIKSIASFDTKTFAKKIVDSVLSKFGGESIPSKTYKVVLQNSVVCSLLNVYSSNFFASTVKKKMSFLEGKLNTQVFGSNICLYDDPFLAESPLNTNFDDEGVATRKTNIVTNGILETYLHNLSTAKYYNVKSTGNGFKPGVSSSVAISTNNLCLKNGDLTFDQLLQKVENGVLITNITGLHAGVNQISGDFNVQCSGYLIENGLKSKPVTLIILSGKFQDVLNNVEFVGSDSLYRNGVYAPSIVVKSMNISGK